MIIYASRGFQVELWLDKMFKRRNYARQRCQRIKEMEAALRHTQRGVVLGRLLHNLNNEIERLQRKLDVGRAIIERLLCAPWATSEAFVRGHLERDLIGSGTGALELTGVGDPSGIGEGFAFVR